MQEIRFSYDLTQDDLSEARKQAKLPQRSSGALDQTLLFILLITLLYATPALWDQIAGHHSSQSALRQIVLGGLPWVYVIAWVRLLTRLERKSTVQMLWKTSPNYHFTHTVRMDNNGIQVESAGGSSLNRWISVVGSGESANLLYFYLSGGSYYFFPKRALPVGTDLSELRQFLGMRMNALALSAEEFAGQRPTPESSALLPRIHFALKMTEFSRARRLLPAMRWLNVLCEMAFIIPLMVIVFWVLVTTDFLGGSIPVLGIWAILFVIIMVVQTLINYFHWKRATWAHGLYVVDITENGLVLSSREATQSIGWGAIQAFRFKRNLFVFTLRDGSFRVIPQSAFPDAQAASAFERLLRERVMPVAGFTVDMHRPVQPVNPGSWPPAVPGAISGSSGPPQAVVVPPIRVVPAPAEAPPR